MRNVVVGLGNTLLSDDGVGVYVARKVEELLQGRTDPPEAEVIEAELAGLDIIEKLDGFGKAYIIDAIILEGYEPGTVFRLSPEDFRTTPRLASFHDIDLVTALELGRRLGLSMPEEVTIYAVQAEDVLTIEEKCTPKVAEVVDKLANEIVSELEGSNGTRVSIDPQFR